MTSRQLQRSCDLKSRNIIRAVGRCARRLGVNVYLVGGVVRDMLLGRRVADLDCVVEGNGRPLAEALAREHKGRMTYYPEFLTATVALPNGRRIDIASSRKEIYRRPGALPAVAPGDLSDDLKRRDFTVNALAAAIVPGGIGELVDICGGREDLRAGRIRVLHLGSFQDDPTRILRAVRFEQRFGFRLEAGTLRGLKAALRQDAPATVTPNRYFAEFRKILKEDDPLKSLRRLSRLKALDFIIKGGSPSWMAMRKVRAALARRSPLEITDRSGVYFLAVMSGYPARLRPRINPALPLTREEKIALNRLADVPGLIKRLGRRGMKPSEVYELLHWVDPLTVQLLILLSSPSAARRAARFWQRDRLVRTDINGRDMAELGIGAGPGMGKILNRILSGKLDGRFPRRADQLRAARDLAKKHLKGK